MKKSTALLLATLATFSTFAHATVNIGCNIDFIQKTEVVKKTLFGSDKHTDITTTSCFSAFGLLTPLVEKASFGCGFNSVYDLQTRVKLLEGNQVRIELFAKNGVMSPFPSESDREFLVDSQDVDLNVLQNVVLQGEVSILYGDVQLSRKERKTVTITNVITECRARITN